MSSLAISDLFAGLLPEELAGFAAQAWRRRFSLNERVFDAGEPAAAFTVIVSGLVKIVRNCPDSSDCILGVFGSRESIGTGAAMEASVYPASAYAVSRAVEVVRIAAGPVLSCMQQNSRVASALNRALLAHEHALRMKIDIMSAGSVPQRLAALFLALAERFGDEMADGTLVVPVVLSRTDLAALVGARVETVIRVVSGWQKAGTFGTTPDGFELLDPKALRAMISSPLRCIRKYAG